MGFEEAVAELSQELGRLAQNLQALTHYQATLLSVNKSLLAHGWRTSMNYPSIGNIFPHLQLLESELGIVW
ncbi:unnamed protein product [Lepidochelys kempii]